MSATASCPSVDMVSTVLAPVVVVVVMRMVVVVTCKCSPLGGRNRSKLRQRWSEIHSGNVLKLVGMVLLLENGWG